MNILEQLYNGTISPTDNINTRDLEYWRQDALIEKQLDKWSQKIGEDGIEFFNEMILIYHHMAHIEKLEAFRYGFSLAVSMMGEANSYTLKLTEN